MDSAVVTALARSRTVSHQQLRGVIGAVAAIEPQLLLELAARDELNDELREHMLRVASRHVVTGLLTVWPPDAALVEFAADADGALPELVALCGSQDWEDLAAELAGRTNWTDIKHVEFLWSRSVNHEFPEAVRITLVDAALTEREPRPKLSSMPEWERREVLDRLVDEERTRHRIAWSLLDDHPELWVSLAREGKHASQVRHVLLEYAEELPDEALVACLPTITGEHWRDDEHLAGIRLREAADYVRRWPRLRQIAPEELRRVTREALESRWQPVPQYGNPEWDAITALAELSDDSQLLSPGVCCTSR